jgi:hypothetical protein
MEGTEKEYSTNSEQRKPYRVKLVLTACAELMLLTCIYKDDSNWAAVGM